jgi:hypothetical protein
MRGAVSLPEQRTGARGTLYLALIFGSGLLMLLALFWAAAGANAFAKRAEAKPSPSLTGSAADFKRAQFTSSTRISNRWMPLKPGTQRIYEGSAILEGEKSRSARRIVSTVTDVGKVIDGVRTLVILEKDYTAGQLGEAEIAFFAQDNNGNVWLLGEYPEEYENGKFVDAPTWIAGQKGARAGIAMLANPRLSSPDYSQGYSPPPADFNDRARVYKTGQRTRTPVKSYSKVLVTEEFEPGVPGAYQLKYYAPGVGNVRVGWRGAKEQEKETLKLVSLKRLSPQAVTKVRKETIALDKRAYKRSSEVYGKTQPAKPL